MKKILKKAFFKLFNGASFFAFSKQLKGVRLIVDPLMPVFHFWRNVDIESHFVYDTLIHDGDVIFDVGGNVGIHSSYFAKRFKNTIVYSFEPLPENATYFKKVMSLNGLKNVYLIEKALGNRTGEIFFDRSSNNHQGHITKAPTNLSVSITTLDNFIQQEKVFPNFIKIDVEGFEADVVSGFQEMVIKVTPTFIIELHNEEQSRGVSNFFRRLPYVIFRLENYKTWNKNKPLTEVENISNGTEAPRGFWGTIVALPLSKRSEIEHLTYRANK